MTRTTRSARLSRLVRRPSGRSVGIVLGGGLVAACVSTAAFAAIPNGSTAVISACYANGATKTLQVIDAQAGGKCPAGTTALSWNGKGVSFKGAYNAATAYQVNDAVTKSGSTYIALLANTGVAVTNTTNWAVLAHKGATGPVGATGAKGATGSQGPAGPTSAGKFVDFDIFLTQVPDAWQTVGSTTYAVPAGANVVGRYAAESFCAGASWCSVRLLVDGVEMAGGSGSGASFDDADPASTWEAHSIDRYAAGLSAGTHTFTVEAQIVSGSTSSLFRLDDDTLVLQTIG